ncbi:hypothetical protein [Clostridium sp. Marseille-P2415]|uniref:hypothetical protein n=1 Tax=Clostridium sp. Marseille-P2415 TaxID=1805471 RepID=UPI0009885687|nr:hypothetical protein [Clostridium sp. Marseille-P2415]
MYFKKEKGIKRKFVKSIVASMTCLSLVFSTGTIAFAADTSVSQQNIQRRVENQIERINTTVSENITDYKFSGNSLMTIEPSITKPELVIKADKLTASDLKFYATKSDEEIYNYLLKIYKKAVQNINNSNQEYKNQLEQQKQTMKLVDINKVKIIDTDPVTKNRTHIIKPYVDSLGYAKLCVYYDVTCQNYRFIDGNVNNCELVERISLGSWEYESGYTYPLIETDNGRYIAFQVTGKWTVGLDHGIGVVYEKWYDFSDYNRF